MYSTNQKKEVKMTVTLNDEKHVEVVYLLDEVVNALANYRSLQRRTSDNFGSMLTSELIEKVKVAISDLGYDPRTLFPTN